MKRTPSRPALGFLLIVLALAVSPLMSFAQSPKYMVMLPPIVPPSITAPAGSTSISTIIVLPLNGFTGKIDFVCTVTGGSPPLPSCPNPLSVTVTGTGAVTSNLAVTTNSSTGGGTYSVTITAADIRGTPSVTGPASMPLSVVHQYGVGSDGGGGIALLTLAGLLALWSTGRLWWGKRAHLQ